MTSLRTLLGSLALVFAFSACGGPQPNAVAPVAIETPVPSGASSAPAAPTKAAGFSAWDEKAKVPVGPDDPIRGPMDALVTIVMFSDFQCPFCSRVEKALTQVLETYPTTVRIVWKNEPLPFHDKAKPAAQMGHAVFMKHGSDAFWRYHDLAFASQRDLDGEDLERYAREAVRGPIDFSKIWDKALKKVEADHELAKTVGINGTPGFLINGRPFSGAQPFEKFKAVIDEELAKTRALAGAGVPADQLYAKSVDGNFKEKAQRPAEEEEEDAEAKKEASIVRKVPIGKSPVRGSADALVTIVVFSDFECPFCKRVGATLDQVKQTYGEKVRFVWKNEPLPFHKRAKPAANFAAEARAQKGDAVFWKVHDRLFQEQPNLDDATFDKIAKEVGLNVAQATAAVANEKHKKLIDADLQLSEDLSASGTPHFFINGRRLVGAQPFEKFKTTIDAEITNAEAMVKRGVAKAKVYDEIMLAAKDTRVQIAIGPKAPVRGPATAKVTMHMFSEYQCPFCGKVEPTLADLMKKYPGKLRIVWHDMPLPFHQDAPLAAQAAREAYAQKGNDGFWKMHDKLFEKQGEPDGLKRAALDTYAAELGLDMTKWTAALSKDTHKQLVDDDMAAAKAAGITGTPHFVINGRLLSGAQPLESFKNAIDRALAE